MEHEVRAGKRTAFQQKEGMPGHGQHQLVALLLAQPGEDGGIAPQNALYPQPYAMMSFAVPKAADYLPQLGECAAFEAEGTDERFRAASTFVGKNRVHGVSFLSSGLYPYAMISFGSHTAGGKIGSCLEASYAILASISSVTP